MTPPAMLVPLLAGLPSWGLGAAVRSLVGAPQGGAQAGPGALRGATGGGR